MSGYQENHYKDRKPADTIEKIQGLLKEIGIETEECLIPGSSAATYSMRVSIRGTSLGSNGKGVSPEFAKASAYAEFMERLQNDIMTVFARYPLREKGYYSFPDEKFFSSEEVAAMDNSYMTYFFECRGVNDASVEEKAAFLRKYHRLDYFMNGVPDRYEARPFYNVKKQSVEYLPYYLYLPYYSSNGMSAGNTAEEALVQGLSEIIERHVQEKIYLKKPALPDIPDDYIQKYPYIWERVEKIRKIPGIRMFLKDCSFGGKYPVAALILIDENTGNYGVKLGCHPDYGVAMERTITEASQGGDFKDYAKRSVLDFTNQNVDSAWNIYNSYKFGQAPFPYEIFGKESAWDFTPVRDVSKMGNREILRIMMKEILDEGYDILIRDVSYTGFPSYHIIVPGLSEIYRDFSTLYAKVLNTKVYLTQFLNYPETIEKKTAKLLKGSLDFWSDSQIECIMKNHYSVYPDFDFPGEEIGLGWLYMSAMCCVYLEEYQEAAGRIRLLLPAAERLKSPQTEFYRCLLHYFTVRGENVCHEKALEYLSLFFDGKLMERLDDGFTEATKVFVKQYPRLDYLGRDGAVDNGHGEYAIWLETKEKMRNYMEKHPIRQEAVRKLLA